MRGEHGVSGWREPRAQSNVIAVVLLAGLVVAGATVVVVAGSSAIDQGRSDAELSTVVSAMQSVDEAVQRASGEEASQWTVEMDRVRSGLEMRETSPGNPAEAGRVTISVSGGPTRNYWLGTLRYEADSQTVAYQGGAVWRSTDEGSVAVSSPPVSYRTAGSGGTVEFPVVTVEGTATGSEFTIESAQRESLMSALGLSSHEVAPGTTITVEIQSEFYRGWAQQLRAEFGKGPVTVDETAKKVTLELRSPTSSRRVRQAAFSDGPTSAISNAGLIESYESPNPGPSGANGQGDVYTRYKFDPTNDVEVKGSVYAQGGSDEITNDVTVHGEVVLGGTPSDGKTDISSAPTLKSLFSTKSDLYVSNHPTFEGEIRVGGVPANGYALKFTSGDPVSIAGDVHSGGKLDTFGPKSFGGDVFVKGDAEFQGGSVTGKLLAEGDGTLKSATFNDVVSTKGGLTFEDSDAANSVYARGDTELKGTSTINGDVRISGDLKIPSSTVTVDGDVYIENGNIEQLEKISEIKGSVYVADNPSETAKIGVDSGNLGDVTIDGNLVVNGDVDLGGGVKVTNIYATGDVQMPPAWATSPDVNNIYDDDTTTGEDDGPGTASDSAVLNRISTNEIAEYDFDANFDYKPPKDPNVALRTPVTSEIQDKKNEYDGGNNDNAGADIDPSNKELDDAPGDDTDEDCDPCVLTAGNYYLSQIDFWKEQLILDTSSGPINIYVENDIEIGGDTANVDVRGPHRANIYVGGTSSDTFKMSNKATFTTDVPSDPGSTDRVASNVWVYLKPDAEVEMSNDMTSFTGVFYGPGTASNPGAKVSLSNDGDIYGAVVGHANQVSNKYAIHYDTSLKSSDVIPGYGTNSVALIEYASFTRRTATVED